MSAPSPSRPLKTWALTLFDFFWQAFVCSFCLRLPLLAVLLIVVALIGGAGEGHGIPDLVYHDDPIAQFWVGLSLGLVTLLALLVGFFLLHADRARLARPVAGPTPAQAETSLPRWPRVYAVGAVLTYLAGAVGVIVAGYLPGVDWLLAFFALAAVVLSAGLLIVVQARWEARLLCQGPRPPEHAALRWPFLAYAGGILASLASFGVALAIIYFVILERANVFGLEREPWDGPAARPTDAPVPAYYWPPLVAGWLGAALLIAAVLRLSLRLAPADSPPTAVDEEVVRDGRYYLFVTALVGLVGVVYLLPVAWVASYFHRWWLGLLAGVACGAVAHAAIRWFWPRRWALVRRAVVQQAHVPALRDHGYFRAAGGVAVMVIASCLIDASPFPLPLLESPVATFCCFLAVLTAAYGAVAFLASRVLPIIAAGLLLLGVAGGIPPIKTRFDGLPGDRGVYDHSSSPVAALNLTKLAPYESSLIDEHDNLLWQREQILKRLPPEGPGAPLDPDLKWELESARARIEEQLEDLEVELRKNKVRPWVVARGYEANDSPRKWRNNYVLTAFDDLRMQSSTEESTEKREPLITEKREPLIVVAVSGGGLRSAVWTLRVLQRLEIDFAKEGIDFPARVRLVCGASGGMLGAAYYVATLPGREARLASIRELKAAGGAVDSTKGRWRDMRTHYDNLCRDFLTPIVKRAVTNDVPAFFSFFPNLSDRGKALEEAWAAGLGGADPAFPEGRQGRKNALDLTFDDLRKREIAGDCPSLVFSPMMVEDGRRLLISNLDLRYIAANNGHRLGVAHAGETTNAPYSVEALELFRLFPQAAEHFKLSTAVRMSASFPYFSPAVSLPTSPRRRIVDAGYYDNFGVGVASAWLFSRKNEKWFDRNANKIVLIQIRDAAGDRSRCLGAVEPENSNLLTRSLEEVSSPPEGLYSSVFAAASFRNDGQLELLSAFFLSNHGRQARLEFEHQLPKYLIDKECKPATVTKEIQLLILETLDLQGEPKLPFRTRLKEYLCEVVKRDDLLKVEALVLDWLKKRFTAERAIKYDRHIDRYFTTATFEFRGRAALSWSLSGRDRQQIDQNVPFPSEQDPRDDGGRTALSPPGKTTHDATIQHLLRWWGVEQTGFWGNRGRWEPPCDPNPPRRAAP